MKKIISPEQWPDWIAVIVTQAIITGLLVLAFDVWDAQF